MRDATEYQFVDGDRRLIVRRAEPGRDTADMRDTAREYAGHWERFLHAIDVTVSDVAALPAGGEAVRISATLPDGLLRAALVRFARGTLVELALTTSPYDRAADAEFERVLASARPAATDPAEAVARSVAAGPHGSAGYPAGPLLLDLPETYAPPSVFTLVSPDDGERYTLERAVGETGLERATGTGPRLATDLGAAVGEDGLPVRFEVSPPRAAIGAGAARSAAVSSPPRERGVEALVAESQGPSVSGTVRGAGVRVRFTGARASAESAEQLIRTLNESDIPPSKRDEP